MGFSLVLDLRCRLGESPVWCAERRALVFVDITGRRLHRFAPATGVHVAVDLPEDIGCVAPARGGGFVAGLRSGVWILDGEGAPLRLLAANPEPHATNRFNDGRVDPRGRFWLGTIDEPKATGSAHLYRYDRRGLVPQLGGILTSNGLAFSPDERSLYHADTPRFAVRRHAYDPETGEIGPGRDFVCLDPHAPDRGRPDGAAVDAEGCYWTALYEGGRVQRYSPAGRLLEEHRLAARCPTAPAFGGDDLRTLYVTSARDGRTAEELEQLPLSGGLFALRVDTPGQPQAPFDPEI